MPCQIWKKQKEINVYFCGEETHIIIATGRNEDYIINVVMCVPKKRKSSRYCIHVDVSKSVERGKGFPNIELN